MALQFVLGGSGSGKTESIYRKVVKEAGQHPKKNYLVIVPEQFTMQTQQKLVELAPNHGIMNIDVLSFKRLAYRVFDELGKTQIPVLEETGKNLVLRKLAQENMDRLTVFGPNMNRMGYIGEVKSLISELAQYNISPEQLQELTKRKEFPAVLRAKLSDIVTMYGAFRDFMEGSFITAEEILRVLIELAPQSKMLRGSVLVFDEFTGFTPIQNDLMKELLVLAEQIYVTVTIDAEEDFYHSRGSGELFDLSKRTILTLMKMAENLKVEVLEPVVLKNPMEKRFVHSPALAFLEANLFRSRPAAFSWEVKEIHMAVLRSPREELAMTARKINELVRKGYRYREIAVVTGAVENYRSYVEPVFHEYEIPYFMDTTKEVLFHPFIEFIRAALEIVESNFSYEAVMRFLRCGFCGLEEDRIDRLDNYLLATGIRGKRAWGRRWVRNVQDQYDLESLEELRRQIYGLLEPLQEVFTEEASVSDGILALYQMLVSLDVEKQLRDREAAFLSRGEQVKSREYGQIYQIVMQLLEKYNDLLGEERLNIQDFIEILDAGLSAAAVATVPPGYDSVTIGDIERTRLNHIKILFFIGVNDGIIPKAAGTGGIISEYERQMLLDADVELAPGAREQAFIQRFYLYRNLTKPSEQLYISYARVDSEGKSQRPSYLVGVLRKLFPNLKTKEVESVEAGEDFYTRSAAFSYLIHGERKEEWYALAKWFFEAGEKEREETGKLLSAAYSCYENEPVSKAVALALYGRKPRESITKLERFASCAYAHYLEYGLKLKERRISGLASVDVGNLYHDAIRRYSEKLEESPFDWFTVSDSVREEMAHEAMSEALEAYPNAGIYDTGESSYRVKRMEGIFRQTIWALTKQVRKGSFVPEKFEISFSETGDLQALQYDLSNDVKMRLKGRIDRIDTFDDGNQISIKVIDYKSGSASFDLVKLYQGRSLQLVVYMDAAMELKRKEKPDRQVLPGGILYYHIDDPVLEADGPMSEEQMQHALLQALRPEGLVNSSEEIYRAMDTDFEGKSEVIPVEIKKSGELSESRSHVASSEDFETMREFTRYKIAQMEQRIYDGDIRINPYPEDSCSYCPYGSVCKINSRLPGFTGRPAEKLKKEEVLDRMKTELAKWKGEHRG